MGMSSSFTTARTHKPFRTYFHKLPLSASRLYLPVFWLKDTRFLTHNMRLTVNKLSTLLPSLLLVPSSLGMWQQALVVAVTAAPLHLPLPPVRPLFPRTLVSFALFPPPAVGIHSLLLFTHRGSHLRFWPHLAGQPPSALTLKETIFELVVFMGGLVQPMEALPPAMGGSVPPLLHVKVPTTLVLPTIIVVGLSGVLPSTTFPPSSSNKVLSGIAFRRRLHWWHLHLVILFHR